MSSDDVIAEHNHAAQAQASTGLPFLGMTMAGGDRALSARFWEKTGPRRYERRDCRSVRVVGGPLVATYHEELAPRPDFRRELTRTVSAWGPRVQAQLAQLHVGIIGAGSVGSVVGEALARMGISRIRLMDFDAVEMVNLDRLLHASQNDALRGRAKVTVLANALRRSATAYPFSVESLEWSITEEMGYRAALDCDVLFSCVDRPWPRSILNYIAYAHLIPVIDGGLLLATKPDGGLRRADWRAHVAAPSRRCLECLEQYDPGMVAADREGYFDDPRYIAGLPLDHPMKRNENVFAFSMADASLEVLQFLSMVVAPLGLHNPGAQMHHFVTGNLDRDERECNVACYFRSLIAKGDRAGGAGIGRHRLAERARQARWPWWKKGWRRLKDLSRRSG